ncbi:DNA methyltransferase [Listeria booriae]|uniref:site-specific DNA-methyltransferase (cytosine-N(4)-specific) n=1 Tax=Listeria booriae TaxID=1552123 RepID=A0A7X0TMB0_9LIST|nr:DNA methyltransferase [Listeria booriae]MBC1331848.1 site-specific DNA-methyltransferase [Listeria booriae]MBC2371269.1 site-specific DNA-methyltransferase [Listeria booriae]MBC2387625.1 site-specific DNA-methyltransferase [Listeria booriae]
MEQLSIFNEYKKEDYKVRLFSANYFHSDHYRKQLENELFDKMEITNKFSRQIVSYQLSKTQELHRWLKYREGFSSELVNILLDEMKISKDNTVLDPFLGSGTTAIVASMRGIKSIGFDILPMSKVAIEVKKNIFKFNVSEIDKVITLIEKICVPAKYKGSLNYLRITTGAYSKEIENEICYITEFNEKASYSDEVKSLVTLCIVNSLEKVSFTAKDGQYLRWDYRSEKVRNTNEKRINDGKKPLKTVLDKGDIPFFKDIVLMELNNVRSDIKKIQKEEKAVEMKIDFKQESSLTGLPYLLDNTIDGVITSPPYCNRYDYTRTYALELAYFGYTDVSIKELRQTLLTSTVENKDKVSSLRKVYKELEREEFYNDVLNKVQENEALSEVISALEAREKNEEINNKGIIRMVYGYFLELTLIFAELHRICKKGAQVAFVNDNVRYGGEVIPVDYLSSDLARQVGFNIEKVYVLPQLKGNSSQQMKKYGRVPLRKSVTIWKK